jgi:hypothetical protein
MKAKCHTAILICGWDSSSTSMAVHPDRSFVFCRRTAVRVRGRLITASVEARLRTLAPSNACRSSYQRSKTHHRYASSTTEKNSTTLCNGFVVSARALSRYALTLRTTVASSEVRPSAVSTEVGSLSVAVRERVCLLSKPVSASLNGANRGVDL